MTKTIASHSFAILTAALMLVGASACSTVPAQNEQSAEVPAAAPAMDETVSNTTMPAADAQVSDTQAQAAPVINEPAPEAAPSSLGASSSGRGH